MAHANRRPNRTRRTVAAITAGLVAAGTATAVSAAPAQAWVDPNFDNSAQWTVRPDNSWDTFSNLRMVDGFALPGYGYRNGFRVRTGVRWDSGLYYGAVSGHVEARAELWVDSPRGPATVPSRFALVSVHAVPAFVDQQGRGGWITGCQADVGAWNVGVPVASASSWGCAAPTVDGPFSNYRMGTYLACVHVKGWAFGDQPSSWFEFSVCPHGAERS